MLEQEAHRQYEAVEKVTHEWFLSYKDSCQGRGSERMGPGRVMTDGQELEDWKSDNVPGTGSRVGEEKKQHG